jgi:glucokinase
MERPQRILSVDLGGTKLALACVDTLLRPLRVSVQPSVTSSREECLAHLFVRLDEMLAVCGPVDAIGVGIASMVDFARGHVVESTNLPLTDVPLGAILRERFRMPVFIDNDATVACIAEHGWGAGVGTSEMLMLTIGTGIGGGIITHGRIYRGRSGAAGELGHVVIVADGPRCQGSCPNHGCLEAFVSGRTLAAHARRLAVERPTSGFGAAAARGEALDGPLVTRLARAGDPAAVAAYEELGRLLGVGLTSLVNVFNPELVVIGGSVVAAGDLLLEPARREIAWRALRPQRDEVRVVEAKFAADAGVLGAAALALTEWQDRR